MYIDSLIENIEYAEDKLEKAENELRHYNDEMKKVCIGLISWIYKHTPITYERKIYSFLYDQAVIRDDRGYPFTTKIPDRQEFKSLYKALLLNDTAINNYKILKDLNGQNYFYVELIYTVYGNYDDGDDYTYDLGDYILPYEMIERYHNIITAEQDKKKKDNEKELTRLLQQRINKMYEIIEENKQLAEKNEQERKLKLEKEKEEKEYQQYLELKKKFEDK